MTRLMMPLAAAFMLAAAAPAQAAPSADELSEPTREAASHETQAERKGGNNNKNSNARASTARGGGAHHQAPNANRGSAQQNNANQARANSNSRAAQAHSTPHQRPSSGPAEVRHHAQQTHKIKTHQAVTAHKRAQAHSRAVQRAKAVNHHRAVVSSRHGHRWYHGIFVYPPRTHTRVVVSGGGGGGGGYGGGGGGGSSRAVDRDDSFALGFRTGSYMNAYDDGGAFSDFGLGVNARWRPVESLGLEAAYTYYNDSFDEFSERETATFQPSVQLFALPWSRVSPYVSAGVTWTQRSYDDAYTSNGQAQEGFIQETAFGPHAGLGLELAFGDRAALDLEGRYIGYLNTADDAGAPSAFQGTAGLNFYF